jgi:hypothetical protein
MAPRFAVLMIGCAALLGGCNPTTVGIAASPLFVEGQQTNLLNASYAGADQLSVQTKQRVPTYSTLRIVPLTEIPRQRNKKDIYNPRLGQLMTDQLHARFQQLGYQMVEGDAKAQVSGVYEVIGKQLAVRLRMTDGRTGAHVGQYDYWMAITGDMRRYMDPNGGGIPIYQMREGLDEMIDR